MIKEFIIKIKSHRLAIVLALFIGIISIAPHLFFAFSVPDYSGIQISGIDAESHYLARINEIYDGHFSLSNVFLPYKDQSYLIPPLGEIIIAFLGNIFFLDVIEINTLSKLIFPFFLFLLIYFFVYKIFLSKSIAILSSVLMFLGYNLISNPSSIINLFHLSSEVNSFLMYTRPINPQISSLFLFGSLLLLLKLLYHNKKNNFWILIVLGILSGLSIYVSIYVWSFLLTFLSIYFIYYFCLKDWIKLKNISIVIFINIVSTIFFWINLLKIRIQPEYLDLSMRQGLIFNHEFIFSLWLLVSLLLILFFWPKEHQKIKKFFLFAIISLWIVSNQQIITGNVLQVGHYHWYITKPIISIILSFLFIYLLKKIINNKIIKNGIIILIIFILFYNGILIQTRAYQYYYQEYLENQRYSEVFSYLKNNYTSSQNILSNIYLSEWLPVYTQHDALNNDYVGLYLNSKDYLIKRLFLNYKLRDINPQDIGELLEKEKSIISNRIFGIYFKEKYGSYDYIPEKIILSLEAMYNDFYDKDYREIFEYFDIDLIVWDKYKYRDLLYQDIAILKEIKTIDNNFIIYEIN